MNGLVKQTLNCGVNGTESLKGKVNVASVQQVGVELPTIDESHEGMYLAVKDGIPVWADPATTGDIEIDNTLILNDGVLSVNTTNNMEQDNTLPITSAGVYATVGNIEALLKTI